MDSLYRNETRFIMNNDTNTYNTNINTRVYAHLSVRSKTPSELLPYLKFIVGFIHAKIFLLHALIYLVWHIENSMTKVDAIYFWELCLEHEL